MEFRIAKQRISKLWFIYAAAIFIILLTQTFFGKFEDKSSDVWSWFFPNVVPTLSLMVSIFVFDIKQESKGRIIDKFYYQLAFYVSILYLSAILLTILVQPFTHYNIVELTKKSSFYLGPFQGLVTGIMGLIFMKAEKTNEGE